MSRESKEQTGIILWLSQQALAIRLVSFFVFVILIAGAIVGATGGLYYLNVSNFPRLVPVALSDTVTTGEFAIFEDEEAYPGAVASDSDGTLYTGSYVNGAVWRIFSNGDSFEIPQSRDLIGSVIGIDVAADGTVYVLDHIDPFSAGGAKIWEISGDTITLRLDTLVRSTIPVGKPNDIAVDAAGRSFVLDIATAQILLLDGDDLSIWWQSPDESYQIAGLAYNSASDSLFMSDVARNAVYEIPMNATDTESARETVFINEEIDSFPAFNGLTIADDGTIYVAAFDINEIWQIIPGTNEHTVLAGNYRGSSDVAYDSANNRLYVNNWDQSWLIPITLVIMQVDVPPRLPFSVDVIEFVP